MKYMYIDNITQEAFMFDTLKELNDYHQENRPSLKLKKGLNRAWYI